MVGEPGAAILAVLTRAPSVGGKTRLFLGLGTAPDPALLEALLLDTLEAAAVSDAARVVAVTPPDALGELGALLPADVGVIAQPPGDLGARMGGVMAALLATGFGRVVLIGSDLPEISADAVAEALTVLSREPDKIVLGPSADGGYYLIAAARVPDVFARVPWGGPTVLRDTIAVAEDRGYRVHLLPLTADVDTLDDLRRVAVARPHSRTACWLRAFNTGRAEAGS